MKDEVKELLIDIVSQSDKERAEKILKKYSNTKSIQVDPFDMSGLEEDKVQKEDEW